MPTRNGFARYFLCPVCARNPKKMALHPADIAIGYRERRVRVTSYMPGLRRVLCDSCTRVVLDEQPGCLCVTHWKGDEPQQWEHDYGTIEEDQDYKAPNVKGFPPNGPSPTFNVSYVPIQEGK